MTATATGRPDYKPGSPEWYKLMTASKIAAVMGHSPHDSYFSMWHKMNGTMRPDPDSDEKRRGDYLEPAVINWFRDQHPEFIVMKSRMYTMYGTRWGATPDAEVAPADPNKEYLPRELVEAKTSTLDWEWGEEGTDQVPIGYYDQGQWQMFVTGRRRVWMPVLLNSLRFTEYVIDYNPEYVAKMVDKATAFMETLDRGQRPSMDPMDGHMQTYRAIRELHPYIDDETIEVDEATAAEFCIAVENRKRAEVREQAAKNMLAQIGGNAHYVVSGRTKLLTRQSRGGGAPYYVAARGLPTIEGN